MSAFDLSDSLIDINQGSESFKVMQMYPSSGNVTNSVVGSGSASGITTFLWQDSANWWLPEQSYFHLRLQFSYAGAFGTNRSTNPYAYVDNFVHTLFTQIQSQINSKQLDILNFPHIVDQTMCYSQSRKTFLDTWGSLSRVGESLMTRIANVSSNSGVVEVIFRPPISLFSAKILPPGAQFNIIFNWASSGLAALETASNASAIAWGTATDQVQITVQAFSFYKAIIQPSPSVQLPQHGVVNLSCTQTNQATLAGNDTLNYVWQPPGYINRLTICLQDNNSTNNNTNGGGIYSATKFNYAVSDNLTSTAYSSSIKNLYITIPELGVQIPNPVYAFTGIQDWMRAYADFCESTQGVAFGVEGSQPFGSQVLPTTTGGSPAAPSNQKSCGVNSLVLKTDATSAKAYCGLPDNKGVYNADPLYVTDPSTVISAIQAYDKNSAYGWAGSPIFVFPVVRPSGKPVTTATINMLLSSAAKSSILYLLSTYNMAIACEHAGNGLYSYSVIQGI